MIEFSLLLIFMIIGAIIAVEIKSLLSSVIALGVVGFALCLIFFILRAPDVAITQIIVEIVVLVILIRATGAKRDLTEVKGGIKEKFALATTILFLVVFSIFSIWAFCDLPKFGVPLMEVSKSYITDGLRKTGAANLVASVLLDYRAYDTLGEATVLFTAVIGAIAILRRKGRKKIDERDDTDS